MAYVPVRGDALLIPSGSNDAQHLFVIATDAAPDRRHLLVNFSSIDPAKYSDPACEVVAGAHPFLTRPSFVAYRFANLYHSVRITRMVDSGLWKPRLAVTEDLLRRILQGCDGSEHTPEFVRQFLNELL